MLPPVTLVVTKSPAHWLGVQLALESVSVVVVPAAVEVPVART
jgi:hypothetical protein